MVESGGAARLGQRGGLLEATLDDEEAVLQVGLESACVAVDGQGDLLDELASYVVLAIGEVEIDARCVGIAAGVGGRWWMMRSSALAVFAAAGAEFHRLARYGLDLEAVDEQLFTGLGVHRVVDELHGDVVGGELVADEYGRLEFAYELMADDARSRLGCWRCDCCCCCCCCFVAAFCCDGRWR